MTENERDCAFALSHCRFQPASFDKRFARDMAARATSRPDDPLSERQHATLVRIVWHYRRQLAAAGFRSWPPDMDAVIAAERERQAGIERESHPTTTSATADNTDAAVTGSIVCRRSVPGADEPVLCYRCWREAEKVRRVRGQLLCAKCEQEAAP